MADWPDADEIKQVLDITSSDWDDTVDRVRSAAIYKVKHDVGQWDEYEDEPDESLAQAALRMAELISLRPAAALETSTDPTYLRLLFGHRKRFAIA
jgi:hypothetical protein